MSERLARLSAIAIAGLLAISLITLYVTSHPGLKGTTARAEFEDAYPLLAGMHVRVYGAIAGTVREVELTDRGTALVSMQLNEGVEPPRRDASAAIRQQDITGDSYVGLSLGNDRQLLGDGVIPMRRTLVAPRFDDLLNSLDEPVREGVRILLVELGKALERRGDDLNAAALRLRPGLQATREIVAELASQNHVLRRLVGDTEHVTSQLAGRSEELARLIDGFARTTRATALHAPGLDRALEVVPETMVTARGTLARLRRLAIAGRPLAETLRRTAPDIAEGATLLGPFVDDAAAALQDLDPTLRLSTRLLRAAEPTFEAASGSRPLTGPFDLAAGVGDMLSSLLGEEKFIRSLFGAESYGVGPSARDDIGLGAIAVESGNQAGYEGNDPARRFIRAVGVPSCEMLGLPIAPGCLTDFLARGAPPPAEPATAARRDERPRSQAGDRPEPRGLPPAPGPTAPPGLGLPPLPDLAPVPGPLSPAVEDLLDFLLGQ